MLVKSLIDRKQISPWSAASLMLCLILITVSNPVIAQEPFEICDGIDNNRDGNIDEGFDVDGDGVARCCSNEPFFATRSHSAQRIDVHYRTCDAGGFTQGIPAAFKAGAEIRLFGVGEFDSNCGLDIIWQDSASPGERYMTTCLQGEWQTLSIGDSEQDYFGGADLNLDGRLDLVGWDVDCCPVNAHAGTTGLNAGGGSPMFVDLYSTYNVSPLQGAFRHHGRPYNSEDFTNDALPDLMLWEYASAGASTELHAYSGTGTGEFNPLVSPMPNLILDQPQAAGDMGDINGDGCTDWVGGGAGSRTNDRGAVFGLFGSCRDGVHTPPAAFDPPNGMLLVDSCNPDSACPGIGPTGGGVSQLYDWDCDGDLDLLTSRILDPNVLADVLYWQNLGNGTFTTTPAIAVPPTSTLGVRIASPLRH